MTDSTSDTTTDTTELASHYIAQVTGDLERNVKEQERVSAEIAALEEQLAVLRRDHSVLLSMQQALGVTAPAAPAEGPAVPTPRKEAPVRPRRARKAAPEGAGKAPGRKAAADSAKKGPARKAAEAAPKRTAARKASGKASSAPTLVDLVHGHLSEQSEPRSAAEVASALGAAHPDREIKTNVVRTTLEGLVAKNRAQRTKQGTSVFYSAADAPDAADAPVTAGPSAAADSAQAPAAAEQSG
ncbi:hypothetical protein [Streptomyces sp. enrichment culture]|uniref:hypothetical protein n=1 Tax=Streptomyces sp. enrichment culture TaxID=1795815 RepID=UPI003F563BF2